MYPALIDCDVHEDISEQDALLPYLTEEWREFVGLGGVCLAEGHATYGLNPWGYVRRDAVPPDGGVPGIIAGVHRPRAAARDQHEITFAVLTGGWMSLSVGALGNPHLARETARALNDYPRQSGGWRPTIGFWDQFAVPTQVPEWAAQEVLSRAGDPRFVQAILHSNPHSFAYGHPIFDPLHRGAGGDRPSCSRCDSLGQAAATAGPAHLAGGRRLPTTASSMAAARRR